jgi:ComF family protein
MFTAGPSTVNFATGCWLTIQNVLTTAGWWLAPPRCLLCDQPGTNPRLDLCAHCLLGLPAQSAPVSPPMGCWSIVISPWRYEYPIDRLIRRLKFQGERVNARLLGTLLGRSRAMARAPLPQVVIPVPLHPLRLRQRGFNQANEIAGFAACELHLPVWPRALRRQRQTRAQSALSAHARISNVRSAFVATRPLAGVSVALVDDVITTGNTAAAAGDALRAAGAARIELWVLAQVRRSPTPIALTGPSLRYPA